MAIYRHLRCLLPITVCCLGQVGQAGPLQDGRFTQILHDVRITRSSGPAVRVTNAITVGSGVIRTGPQSRAQMSFADRTVVRIGDKTELGVDADVRSFNLDSGAILAQVPPGVGRTTLSVRGITATATGTALVVECVPQAYTKFISLDGTSRLCLKKSWTSDCVLLRPGQMIIVGPNAKTLPEAVDVDLTHLVDTCQLITEFARLPGHDRLVKAAAAQREQKTHGAFADSNLVIFGRGTLVTQPNRASPTPSANSRSATPKP